MKWLPGPETMFVLGAILVVPAILARFLVGASWLQVGCAFPLWFLALWLFLGGPSILRDEGIGWTIIMSLFFAWVGVPLAALLLRVVDVPYRLF